MPLKKIYLWLGNFDAYAASLADPDCFDSNRNSTQIRAANPHGFYYINSDTLESANGYLYHDAAGLMPVDLWGIIGHSWIADEYGNVTRLNIQSTGTTIITNETTTWQGTTNHLDYPFQFFNIYTKTTNETSGNGTVYPHGHYLVYGSAHRKHQNLEAPVSGNNYVSHTPYRTGKMNGSYNSYTHPSQIYTVDMSVSGMVKPIIRLDASSSGLGNLSASNIFHTNTSGTTMTLDSAGIGSATINGVNLTVDWTAAQGSAAWNGLGSQGRLHTQVDYVNVDRDVDPAGLSFTTSWYIQYAFMTDPGQGGTSSSTWFSYGSYAHGYGWSTSDSYPLSSTYAQCTYACTGSSFNSGNLHHGNAAHLPHMDTFYSRLFLLSSTPNATGGDDDGDPPKGWYRETGTTTYYYWNGFKFVEDNS